MISIRALKPDEFDDATDFIQSIFPDAIIQFSDEDVVLLAEYQNSVVGFAHVVDDDERIIIRGIGVANSMRGKGVGTLLLDHLLAIIGDDTRPIYLKVRYTNPAIDLYLRYGFLLKKFGPISVLVRKQNN
ncbi:GNAT family N-acetyltransferase [Candidatus Micrarchaeota archaeon]|nr:GNAT family N-acetyltransferase [Candidatus Micrarchaeota archaeon]MBU1165578.1 GNAT family N-acetyltransferase [Candidatus Micrarchaeota archaeon]MBU1887389.1 GNAT family N-acetyltransferase [Candidatus Micrarchaeota archaeon]